MNATIDRVQVKINEMENIAVDLEQLYRNFINECQTYQRGSRTRSYHWKVLSYELKEKQREIKRMYQKYYATSKELVEEYIPSKLSEFKQCYSFPTFKNKYSGGVLEYIELKSIPYYCNKKRYLYNFIDAFEIQRSIVLSIPDVIVVADLNLRKRISSEFIQSELDESELLFENEFYRASGAIAGVALERHLKFLCDKNEIIYSSKDSISKINDKLKDNKIFGIDQWRHIQHLGDLRNKCDHPDEEPVTENNVRKLIDGVNELIQECN